MWRWILVLALAMASLSASPAAAEDQLDISYTSSLGGLMKYDQWTRLQVTLTNHNGPFSGVLELGTDNERQNGYDSSYRQKVSLKKDESNVYEFDIPVEILMRGNSLLRVTQDGKTLATEHLLSFRAKDEQTVGVIDKNENAFHFLTMGSERPSMIERYIPFTVQNLQPDTLPQDSWILKNLDILAIGNVDPTQISKQQLSAIKEWIYRGGVVILSTGPNHNEILNHFADLLPFKPGSSGVRSDLTELKTYTGETQLPFSSIPVLNVNQPLFLSKQIGAGVLLIANYDVTAEPLASWQYNRQVWQNVMKKHKITEIIEKRLNHAPIDMSLVSFSSTIPGVSTPSVGWTILIWTIYLIVIAPLLYLVLKRLERREWAWGIIPVFALVLSLGVYVIGRPMVVKEDTSYVVSSLEVLDEKLAEVRTGASFLTISGGSYGVKTAAGFLAIPLSSKRNDIAAEGNILSDASDQSKSIAFDNVPYLSVKQAYATGVRHDVGSFASALTVKGDRLQGTVKNNTSYDLDEMNVDLGMQRISVGPLKKGEEKQLDAKIEKFYLPKQFDLQQDQPLSREQRIEQMKYDISQGYFPNQVHLVGIHKQDMNVLSMERENQAHFWNAIHQTVKLVPGENGKIIYPYGTLAVNVAGTEGLFESKSVNLYELAKGSVTFALSVEQPDLQLERVLIPLDQSPYRPFKKELFHVKTGQWEKLEREQGVDLQGNIKEYINRNGSILIRFTNPSDQRLSLPQPFFQVEGKEE